MPTQTNSDVVRRIASFIPPNPVIYTALAAVNRDFYAEFTSDRLWLQLDAYNLKQDIFKDFIARIPTFERLMCYSWVPKKSFMEHHPTPPPSTKNLYAVVGGVATRANKLPDFKDAKVYKNMALILAGLGVPLGYDAMLDEEVALRACAKVTWINSRAQQKYGLEFGRKVFDTVLSCPDSIGFPLRYWAGLLEDDDFVKHALEVCPQTFANAISQSVIDNVKAGRRCFDHGPVEIPLYSFGDTVVKILKRFVKTREQVLRIVAGNPYVLDVFPEYWKDREVCLKAVDGVWPLPTEHYDTPRFLETCAHPEVFARLVPAAFKWMPQEFWPADTIMGTVDSYFDPTLDETQDDSKPFCHPDTVEKLAGLAHHTTLTTRFWGRMSLIILGEDREWLAQRIPQTPSVWNFASFTNQKDVELCLMALNASKLHKGGPECGMVDVNCIPIQLTKNPRVAKLLASMGYLNRIPKGSQSLEMALIYFNENVKRNTPRDNGMFGISDELLFPLSLRDRSVFSYCNRFQHEALVKLWKGYYGSDQFQYFTCWPPLRDPSDAKEVIQYYEPAVHNINRLPIKVDAEFMAAVVRRNGRQFRFLPEEYQQNKLVQDSIGPLGWQTALEASKDGHTIE